MLDLTNMTERERAIMSAQTFCDEFPSLSCVPEEEREYYCYCKGIIDGSKIKA